jgi:dolichyl-phosphate beta-glucosyltransferase
MSLSIVFPAFDEENKIEKDVVNASEFMKSNRIKGEIVIVDDGSTDNTFQIALKLKETLPTEIHIIKHQNNLGKGFAVRSGVLKSKYDYILYSDMGSIVPLNYSINGIDLLESTEADIAHGSRKLKNSVITKEQDKDRKIASWLFNKIMLRHFKIPVHLTDTQCGFKIYKKDIAKKLYNGLKISGFLFEIEIILKAVKLNYNIVEFPIEWRCDRDSRISLLRTTPEVIKEYLKIIKMKKKI